MDLPTSPLALDSRGLDNLKRAAHESPDKALRTAATQFEALFMNMILKNMRDAAPKDGLLSSSAGSTYTGMLDQQLAQKLAGRGNGLADMLVRQLSRNVKPAAPAQAAPAPGADSGAPARRLSGTPLSATIPAVRSEALETLKRAQQAASSALATHPAAASQKTLAASAADKKRDFIARVAQHAKDAEQQTGVPAQFMIGQAALESGWGKHEIKDGTGQSAFNVFGVKATGNWHGPTVAVSTTEFVDGVARKVVAKFRAYASYAESFADYARMIANNPRYANVLKTAQQGVESFAQGLQKAGYATDPGYAAKLTRVINDAVHIDRQA